MREENRGLLLRSYSQKRKLKSDSKAEASSDGKDSEHTVFLCFMLSVNCQSPAAVSTRFTRPYATCPLVFTVCLIAKQVETSNVHHVIPSNLDNSVISTPAFLHEDRTVTLFSFLFSLHHSLIDWKSEYHSLFSQVSTANLYPHERFQNCNRTNQPTNECSEYEVPFYLQVSPQLMI